MKQLFPLLLAILISLIAYLQAAGLGYLIAANVGDVVLDKHGDMSANVQRFAAWAERTIDGRAILARNPFDSITGPLNVSTPEETVRKNAENPYTDPPCESVRVVIITTGDDPRWAFASIAVGKDRAMLRRVGDEVGDRVVQAMTWDRVWLVKNGARCQVRLHDSTTQPEDRFLPPPPPPPTSRSSGLPPEIANRIQKITDTQYNVDRSVVDEIASNLPRYIRSVRIVPVHDAEGSSLKLVGIRQGSLLHSLGLVNGDKLQNINGYDMSDPMIAMQAYNRLLGADKLEVHVVRAGKPMTVEVNMR